MKGPGSPDILVIDDSPEVQALLVRQLRQIFPSVRVRSAENMHEAIDRLREARPELVILDLGLKADSGLRFLKLFPKGVREYPVLVFTGDASKSTLTEAVRLGADDFLNKPVDPLVLESKTESLLSGRYSSPMKFFGRRDGIASITLRFTAEVESLSETDVSLVTPMACAPGTAFLLGLGLLEVPCKVTSCWNGDVSGTFQLHAKPDRNLSLLFRVELRRHIQALSRSAI